MRRIVFGTAQLYGLASPRRSEQILTEAWRCGVRAFDTAPSYGSGQSEPRLGEFLAGRQGALISTKVGLAPPVGPAPARKFAAAVAKRLLPPHVIAGLRSSAQGASMGRFSVSEVRTTVDLSLRRLGGRIDRLLLHEVVPEDISDGLLGLLDGYRENGDIGQIGVATQNSSTLPALNRGGALFSIAHFAVGPLHEPIVCPPHVTTRVGHGLLGESGQHVSVLESLISQSPDTGVRWREATANTEWADMARAMLARATLLDLTDVIVATTRLENVASAVALAGQSQPLPAAIGEIIDDLASRAAVSRTQQP